MKNRKVIMLGNEQLNKKDLDAIHELQEGLNKVDQFPIYTPDLYWFEKVVLEEQERSRRRLIKDLFMFIFVAVCILSGIIVSLYHMPVIFIFLQIITVVFLVLYSGIRLMKQVNNG